MSDKPAPLDVGSDWPSVCASLNPGETREVISDGWNCTIGRGFRLIVSGDCRMDGLSEHPMARSKCPKCGYTFTTNEAPQDWKCPIDGEVLGSVPYP